MNFFLKLAAFFALSLAAAAFIGATAAVSADLGPEFLSADEIRPGMRGYALAQFYADKIERFDIEIISVASKRHAGRGYYRRIVALAGGGPLEISRGISTGFSGAPVYLDGRLAGAIESTSAWTAKNYVTIITADELLSLFDAPSFAPPHAPDISGAEIETGELSPAISDGGREYREIEIADSAAAYARAPKPRAMRFVRASGGPVMSDPATGEAWLLESRERGAAADYSAPLLTPLYGPGGDGFPSLQTTPPFSEKYYPIGAPVAYSQFVPGAMISIPLVRGDLDIYLNGTLTYVGESGRFIAFGHSIAGGRGSTRLPVARAHVYTTHTQLDENWSLIKTGPLAGTLLEDRAMGGAGTLAPYEEWCPVRVGVRVHDAGTYDESHVEIAKDARAFRDSLPAAVGWMLERCADQSGEGTAAFTIAVGLPGRREPMILSDAMYSAGDWAWLAAAVASSLAWRLTANELGEFVPEWMDIECDLYSGENTARIDRPVFGLVSGDSFAPFEGQPGVEEGITRKVWPGEIIGASFELVFPDGTRLERFASVPVPLVFPGGPCRIQLRGSGARMPEGRSAPQVLMDAYAREAGDLVRYYRPPGAPTRDALYAELSEYEGGGAVVIELVCADEKNRGADGFMPRARKVIAIDSAPRDAPEFGWLDVRGMWGMGLECAE
ncbi:MAG: hypothetical protein HRF49_03885 [bacterium]